MTLGDLLREIEDTVARRTADAAAESIAVLSAVIRARSSDQSPQCRAPSSEVRNTDGETPRSCSKVRGYPLPPGQSEQL